MLDFEDQHAPEGEDEVVGDVLVEYRRERRDELERFRTLGKLVEDEANYRWFGLTQKVNELF